MDERKVRAKWMPEHVGFSEASEIGREDRNAAERRFDADEPEGLRPHRGHEQDARARVDFLVDQLVWYGRNDADVGQDFPTENSRREKRNHTNSAAVSAS